MKKQMKYTSPSIKVLKMVLKNCVMIDTFSGGDEGNCIVIDPEADYSGQVNRANRGIWD